MINPLSLVAAAVAVVVGIRCAILGCKGPASSSSVEIAPCVRMPLVFNGMSTDHGLWLASGGRCIDTAYLYGDELQRHVASGIAASGVEREEVFVTTKVNCCPTDRCSRFCAHPPRPTSAPPMSVHNGSEMLKHSLAMTGQRYVDPPLRAAAQDRLRRLLAARVDQQSRRAQPPCRPRGCRGAREDAGAGRLVGVPCPTPTHVHDASICHPQVALKWLVQQGIAAVTNTARPKHAAEPEALDLGSFTLSAREMRARRKVRCGAL